MADLPGEPLPSGFRTLTPDEREAVRLSPEARARVLAFMEEAERCRGRAAAEARTAVIG